MFKKVKLFKLSALTWKALSTIALFSIYSLFSSSTPDRFGIAEFLVLICLISLFVSSNYKNSIQNGILMVFWVFALVLGLLTKEKWPLVIRDIIPHFFVLLLFLKLRYSEKYLWDHVIMISSAIIAIRFFIITGFSLQLLLQGTKFAFDGFLKLNSDPILFYGCVLSLEYIFDEPNSRLRSAVYMIIFLVTFLVPIMAISRGPLALILSSIIVMIFRKGHYWTIIIIPILLTVYFQELQNIFALFQDKFERAGGAEKLQEFVDVFKLNLSFANMFVGKGFGTYLDLGWANYRFSHSAISYYAAKTGVATSALLVAWAVSLILKLERKRDGITVLLLAFLLLYGLVLNPWYKFMSYWFIFLHFYSFRLCAKR